VRPPEAELVTLRPVIAPLQPVASALQYVNLMQAASLRASRPTITAAEVLKMQNNDTKILEISGKFVSRPLTPTNSGYSAANLWGQFLKMLGIPTILMMHAAAESECGASREQPYGDQN
jgi:hypothetical protein